MKYFGLLISLAIIAGAAIQVGPHLYTDIMSVIFVVGGALGFALLRNEPLQITKNFGAGAVYFGWLGFLIGVVAIAQNLDTISDEGGLNVIRLGEAASIGMLTVLYGYLTSWVVVPVIKSLTQDG